MSDSMINMKILRKFGGEIESAIKCRCVEPCSTEEYVNEMEDIITRTRICKTWTRRPITCPQKTKINEAQVIEEVQCSEGKEESEQDSAIYEDTPVEEYPIEKITALFEVTELHTHLQQYSEDYYKLISLQEARVCKTKPAIGKAYTSGESFITSILINCVGAKVILDTGAF
ncbi:hypothetical protein O181_026376 [Austropuccinia psidii MF-1]|uniref:Uncharacterized protein n=1 Tax=Austropuccinia psidii MF-1 TaxID=1389203 RepID=A0A9Q3CKB9_9BASI|nr:hypothetical protein [Austropuccinia psidii MF-1]